MFDKASPGQQAASPGHGAYATLRGEVRPATEHFVTASGVIDAGLRVFRSGEVPALVVTAPAGARQLRRSGMPPSVRVAAGERADRLSAGSIREAVGRAPRPT